MKRKIALTITAGLLIATMMTGCNSEPKYKVVESESVESEPESVEVKTVTVIGSDKDYEKESDSEVDVMTRPVEEESVQRGIVIAIPHHVPKQDEKVYSYTKLSGTDKNGDKYIFDVPRFNAPNAASLNSKLEAEYDSVVEEEMDNVNGGNDLWVYSITYDVVSYGNWITVVVRTMDNWDGERYASFTYDFAKDKEVTASEIIKEGGWGVDEIKEKIMIQSNLEFNQNFPDAGPNAFKEDKAEAKKRVDNLEVPMYLNDLGQLTIGVPIIELNGLYTMFTTFVK